jgi:hypothetical protein
MYETIVRRYHTWYKNVHTICDCLRASWGDSVQGIRWLRNWGKVLSVPHPYIHFLNNRKVSWTWHLLEQISKDHSYLSSQPTAKSDVWIKSYPSCKDSPRSTSAETTKSSAPRIGMRTDRNRRPKSYCTEKVARLGFEPRASHLM